MLKIMSGACAALMVLTAPLATPALAMPMAAPATAPSAIILAQADGSSPNISPGIDPRWDRRQPRERDWDRNWDRRDRGWDRRVERRGDHAYWRGHRGYRDPRPGYRRHGDFWFPPAAFIAGAIIGGALANQPAPPPARYYGNAHVEWCYARYRSYRSSDNTFQPYNGPRRQCRSPYG